jgi:hypothetical protein
VESLEADIYSIAGEKISQIRETAPLGQTASLNLSTWAPGIYFARVKRHLRSGETAVTVIQWAVVK